MSPILKRKSGGLGYKQVSSTESRQIQIQASKEPNILRVVGRIICDLTGALMGLATGTFATGTIEYITQNVLHESILSNPIGIALTAVALLGTTTLGFMMGDSLGKRM